MSYAFWHVADYDQADFPISILHLTVDIIGGELHTFILDYTHTNPFILSFFYSYIVACKPIPFHFAVAVAYASVILYSWYVALQTHIVSYLYYAFNRM